jgi:prepilin-type N-terminal cleavage/methylation domain-containing protein
MLNCGYSLLELLIALFLGALVISGALEMYLNFKLYYRRYQMQSLEEAELRLAIFKINREIRLAGFSSCIKKVDDQENLRGYTAQTLPSIWAVRAKEKSDILLLRECLWYQDRWQFISEIFYIGKTGRKDPKGKWIYALYNKKLSSRAEELAESIQELKIRYGIRNPQKPEVAYYQKSNLVQNWRSVISVEYQLNNKINAYASLRGRN